MCLQLRTLPGPSKSTKKPLKELIHNISLVVLSRTESLNGGKPAGSLFQDVVLAVLVPHNRAGWGQIQLDD